MKWSIPWLRVPCSPPRPGRSIRGIFFRPRLERLEERLPPAQDTLATAFPLSFAASPVAQVSGTLTSTNQVDLYKAVNLSAGDQLTASINAQQQGSSLEAALRLFDSSGAAVALATYNPSSGDPQLTYNVTVSGTYNVGVSSAGDVNYDPTAGGSGTNGTSTGLYSLSITDLLARFVNAPSLGNGNQELHGTLSHGQPQDYSITVTSGKDDTLLLATAVPQASPGFEPRLTLYDGTGQLLIQSDQQGPGLASATVQQHLQPGTYYLEVSAAASSSVSPSSQAYELTTTLPASLPPFAPLPVGGQEVRVAVADLNGDGIPDIVTANTGSYYNLGNTVSVLLGNGDGSFQPQQTLAVGSDPDAVAVADLGNGHPDIVTANTGDFPGTVSVLLGNGDGTFQPQQTFAVGSDPSAVAVADLNGDGKPDLIVANSAPTFAVSFTGTVTGGTFILMEYRQKTSPLSFDASAKEVQDALSALRNVGSGNVLVSGSPGKYLVTFRDATPLPLPAPAALSSLVGSSPAVSVTRDGTVSVLLGNGDGTFQPQQTLAVGSNPSAVAVADLNGDGKPDLVVANRGILDYSTGTYNSTVSVLLGNGDGTFQPQQTLAVGSNPEGVAVADLGNGHPDIVTANAITANQDGNTVSVFLGNGDGTFQPQQTFPVGSDPAGVAVADLGNGHPDIVTANAGDNTVSVLLGNGDGTFLPQQTLAGGGATGALAVADLGNGHPDIVTASVTYNPSTQTFPTTVSVLLGNGDGTFQHQTLAIGGQPDGVAVADLGNGHPDIVTANSSDNTVSVLLGNGDGYFGPQQTFAVGGHPEGVAVADLGNGHPDIVTANANDNTVSVLLGNGDGTFQPQQTFAVGGGPDEVAVADLNGDGKPDLVVANRYSNTVSVLLGNGDGTFQPQQTLAGGSNPDEVAVADLGNGHPDLVTVNLGDNTVSVLLGNGDGTFLPQQTLAVGSQPVALAVADLGNGHPDLVTVNLADNTVSVLLGNGDGTFQPQQTFAVGSEPVALAVADLGNGHPDIVTANYLDDTLSVLLGNGDGTFQPQQTLAVGNRPAAVAVADLTGDGRPDIVTANRGDNTVSVLLNQGHEQFQAGALPAASPARTLPLCKTSRATASPTR